MNVMKEIKLKEIMVLDQVAKLLEQEVQINSQRDKIQVQEIKIDEQKSIIDEHIANFTVMGNEVIEKEAIIQNQASEIIKQQEIKKFSKV